MSQENKGKDLSITELLKKLREQADAETDPEEDAYGASEPETPDESPERDEGEDEIKAELSRILAKIGTASAKDELPEEKAAPEEETAPASEEAPEETPDEPETAPEKPEKDGEAGKNLKDLILRLNRKAETSPAPEEIPSEPEPADEKEPVSEKKPGKEPEAEQISLFDGLDEVFSELLPEKENGLSESASAEETPDEDFSEPLPEADLDEEENDELNESLRELVSMIGPEEAPEAAEDPEAEKAEETEEPEETAKNGGARYHFTVTKKPVSEPVTEEVVPSAKEYEEAKQDIADFSEEKAETREAPAFSGWKMLKNIFGIGKDKNGETPSGEETPTADEPDKTVPAEELPADEEIPDAEQPETPAPEEAEPEAPAEAETGHTFREDDGTAAPAALFYAANRAEEAAENGIAPDPELFDRIREEYPVAMNDMGTTAQVGREDTRTDGKKADGSVPEQSADAEAPDPSAEPEDGEPLSDGDLDQMMQRFLTKETYEEYANDADLAESRRRMGQIRLDDPETASAAKAKEEKPAGKGDTREVPSASSGSAKEDSFDEKMPLNSLFDSETFVPPEIEPDEEAEEEEINKDISILVAFGREEDARGKYGDERVDAFLKEVSGTKKSRKEEEPEEEPELPETEESEYENFGQNKEIFRAFKKKYRLSLIRLTLCGILMLLAFFLENYGVFGMTPITALDPELFPLIYVMADLQLLVLGCLLARGPIIDGAKSLFRREPDPSVFVTASAVFCFAYTVYAAFFPAGLIRLYTFPFLLLCFVCILCGYFDLRREIMTFRVVSSKRTKYVIGSLSEEEASLEEEAFENYLPEEPTIFKLGKANFVDGFFRRCRGKSAAKKMVLLVPPFALAIGIAFLAMSVFFGGETASAVTVGITALMMSLPAAMFLTYSYPFYTAAGHAYDTESAIVGETSLEEYCDAASVSFEDTDVFPSRGVKVRSVMVFGENRIDEVINNVTSVFHVAGGPLSDVLDIITSDLRTDEDTRLLSVAPDGIEADVSGTHMYLGKADYLRRNHYVPIVSDEDREIERSGSLSIMYVVSGDEVVAKFYLAYRIDPDFEKILKQMYRSGICVGIKTFDPNIDDDMLSRRIRIERYPVRVLKCREIGDEPRVADRADSGIVSKRSAKALLGAFAVCGKVQTVTRVGIVLNFISLFAAAMVMGVTMLFGAADKIPSLYVALYQLFWTIPIFVMARLHVK